MVGCWRLPAAVAALLATTLEAVRAIDRLVTTRNERDHRLLATGAADGRVHGALGATTTVTAAAVPVGSAATRVAAGLIGTPAGRATSGLVSEALLGIEFLLAYGEDEIFATITTGHGLIYETHLVEFSYVPLHHSGGFRTVNLGSGFLGKMSSGTGPRCRTGQSLGNLWPLSMELTPDRAIMLVLAKADFPHVRGKIGPIWRSDELRASMPFSRIAPPHSLNRLRGDAR